MSEFLKNFRSAHSRYSGNKRNPYDGHYYPAQERRNGNDRRTESSHPSPKSSNALVHKLEEFLPRLQELLETITENQQILIDMKDRQTQSGELMALAFKDIAALLKAVTPSAKDVQTDRPASEPASDESVMTVKDLEQTEMKSSADEKKDVIRIMKKLRKKGGTYKEIANFLNENKIPTFSNKGHWHAQTIHRLCSR
jgi:hypothetical protein